LQNLSEKFGQAVRILRLQKNLSQEKLAEMANLDRTYISMIERGKRKPTIDVAKSIADALGYKLSKIINDIEAK
jgi:transcriptional regulator with XRE-family HTH domain